MNSEIDIKFIIKLAKACQKAGISHFSGFGIEFDLVGSSVSSQKSKSKKGSPTKQQHEEQGEIDTDGWDSLTPEEKLFWSSTLPDSAGLDPTPTKKQ